MQTNDLKALFLERLGNHPLCSNDYRHGSYRRPAAQAIEYHHIEPNPPHVFAWLVFDIDEPGGALKPEAAWLPPPSISCVNRTNGHAHLLYGLATPVVRTGAGREAPLRYFKAVYEAYRLALNADPCFSGPLAKNPLSAHWKTRWVNKVYELPELAEYVSLPRQGLTLTPSILDHTFGRNKTLFQALRTWAYRNLRQYRNSHAPYEAWAAAVIRQAESMNTFSPPLPYSEVKAAWSGHLLKNEKLADQAKNNSLEQFVLGDFKEIFTDVVLESQDGHNKIANQLLKDERIFAAMQGMLAQMVYSAFRRGDASSGSGV